MGLGARPLPHLPGVANPGQQREIGERELGRVAGCRLLPASDGAYEPFHDFALEEEFGKALALPRPTDAVRAVLDLAARRAPARADNATVVVTDLPGGRVRPPNRTRQSRAANLKPYEPQEATAPAFSHRAAVRRSVHPCGY